MKLTWVIRLQLRSWVDGFYACAHEIPLYQHRDAKCFHVQLFCLCFGCFDTENMQRYGIVMIMMMLTFVDGSIRWRDRRVELVLSTIINTTTTSAINSSSMTIMFCHTYFATSQAVPFTPLSWYHPQLYAREHESYWYFSRHLFSIEVCHHPFKRELQHTAGVHYADVNMMCGETRLISWLILLLGLSWL